MHLCRRCLAWRGSARSDGGSGGGCDASGGSGGSRGGFNGFEEQRQQSVAACEFDAPADSPTYAVCASSSGGRGDISSFMTTEYEALLVLGLMEGLSRSKRNCVWLSC